MPLNHEKMHSDNIGIEQTTLKRDIPTGKEIVPAISQNVIQETLLASSNVSVTSESLTTVNQTANCP